ncbi:glycosyltransferase family 2 protein [Kosakonia sp. LAM2021]|uniref:glycosyltransferase family 2 protein n=1 Tax=Kosakonia sp. LAM2021 TaxID=2800475 RepID=UPI00190D5C23|nr:glycosyltransferase family 2 protein [Kosakonia sp. LAM2021]
MISAIIVTFYPQQNRLSALISALEGQVNNIFIIDNSPDDPAILLSMASSDVVVHPLGKNVGIAQAQNIGIKMSKERGAKDIILFDQDSIPSATLVSELLAARECAARDGVTVAAVGPVHFDLDSGLPSRFVRTQGLALKLIKPDFKSVWFIADFIIASGSLISLEVLEEVGLMCDELFIDCVDIEWGYRAQAQGLACVIAQGAKMDHKIGDKPLILLGRQITTHAPVRHYYFFRNVMLLLKRNYIPIGWKLNVSAKSLAQAIIFTLLLKPRYTHFKYIAKGFIDGILGRTGPYER